MKDRDGRNEGPCPGLDVSLLIERGLSAGGIGSNFWTASIIIRRVWLIDPRLVFAQSRPRRSSASVSWEIRVSEPDQSGGNTDIIKRRRHFLRQAAFGMIHVGLGEILGERQQFERRNGMMKQVRKTFQQQALRFAEFFEPRGGRGIESAQIHKDGRGHLMAKNGAQLFRPPKRRVLGPGREEGGEALRRAFA